MAKTILVDIDRTIADYDKRYMELAVEKGILDSGTIIPWGTSEKIPEYFPDKKDALKSVLFDPTFYDTVEPLSGAVNALKEIQDEGYIVKFASAFPLHPQTYHQFSAKANWIDRTFGSEWVEHLIQVKDKSYIFGDYLIDDKPAPRMGVKPSWEQIVYNQPFNQHITDRPRLKNWANWKSELADYL